MQRYLLFLLLAVSTALLDGCKPSAKAPTDSADNSSSTNIEAFTPTQAQPKLQTLKLWIGSKEMNAELALNQVQEQTGMMFRTNIEENDGMLFIFPQPIQASFWMKNTLLPLSAAYIGPDGTILEIHDLKPQDTTPVLSATDSILFVLETKQGWFQRNNINVGTVISTERGPLHKVFFGR